MTKRLAPLPLAPLIEDDGEPQYVRELLEAGRDDVVADYDVKQGLAKHLGLVALGAPMPDWAKTLEATQSSAATTTAASSGALGSSTIAWVALPLVTASVAAAVIFVSGREPAQVVRTELPAVVVAPSAPLALPADVVLPAPVEAPPLVETPPLVEAPAPVQPATSVKQERAARAPRERVVVSARGAQAAVVPSATSGAAQPSGSAEDLFERAEPATAPEPKAEQEAKAEQKQPASPPAEQAAVSRDDASLEREMGMLSMTQRVLHTDPARALALARQGEAEFAGSMFTQERRQLLLLSLIKLGQLEEAKRLAKPYLARYPKGPFSDRVRRALSAGR